MDEILDALLWFLTTFKPYYDLALGKYGLQVQEIYDFERQNIDMGQFPCLVLNEFRQTGTEMVAAPYIAQFDYTGSIMGYVVYDGDDGSAQHAIREFADSVQKSFELVAYQPIPIYDENGHERPYGLHIINRLPVVANSFQYEIGNDNQLMLRMFQIDVELHVTRSLAVCTDLILAQLRDGTQTLQDVLGL